MKYQHFSIIHYCFPINCFTKLCPGRAGIFFLIGGATGEEEKDPLRAAGLGQPAPLVAGSSRRNRRDVARPDGAGGAVDGVFSGGAEGVGPERDRGREGRRCGAFFFFFGAVVAAVDQL